MVDVGLREGNRVAPIRIDRDIVAADQHGNHRRSRKSVFLRDFCDLFPGLGYRLLDDPVEAVVHFHDEPLEPAFINVAGVIFVVIRWFFEGIEVTTGPFECLAEVTHDRTHSVTVNVNHADG